MSVKSLIWIFTVSFLLPCVDAAQFNTLGKWRGSKIGEVPDVVDTKEETHSMDVVVEKSSKPFTSSASLVSPPLKELMVTSPRGMRVHPVHGGHSMHNGIDLEARYEPVYSVMDGMVEDIGCDRVSGNWIRLLHGDGVRSSYSHLSEIHVREGWRVSAGQTIGISGNTGRSTGPHLHFRISLPKKRD